MAFTLGMSVFHDRRFLRKGDDLRSFLSYFGVFFCLFLVIPCLIIVFFFPEPLLFLRKSGLTLGNAGRGLWIAVGGAPIAVLSGFVGSRDERLRRFYPFSKVACRSLRTFIAFETAYVFLYYVSWEFFYRGILFFPLIPVLGLVPALALQTLVSTLHHAGHPPSEIFASLAAGVVFGLIAYFTGSFLYTIFLHALTGVSTDTFIYLRDYRRTARR
ncbi:MAG: CPBP family intramembrane metalloprotease [Candidatus Aminicenantes bacterium]|nr:CPBP family intramembrane metalloprotease [Candidatus Aminicenantes bacterium]